MIVGHKKNNNGHSAFTTISFACWLRAGGLKNNNNNSNSNSNKGQSNLAIGGIAVTDTDDDV